MADQVYTFAGLKSAALHAVAKSALDTGSSETDIVNDAIVYLWTLRRWRWRQVSENLSLVANQSYIALAADYGRTLSLAGYIGTNYRVRPVTIGVLNEMRQRQGLSGFDLFYAISWTPQTGVTLSPVARLEIFPTPAGNVSNALTHIYEKRVPKLSGATDVPDFPSDYLPALHKLVRARALDETNGEGAGTGEMAWFERMIQPLIDEDELSQPNSSPVPGTVQMISDQWPMDARFFPTTSPTVS